jgi:hypothetical protein
VTTTPVQTIEEASREALENAALMFAQTGKEIRELKVRLQELERAHMEAEAVCRKAWSNTPGNAHKTQPAVEACPPDEAPSTDAGGHRTSDRQSRILDLLSNGAKKCAEIQRDLQESSYQNVFSTLGHMRRRGLVQQLENKSWKLEDQPETNAPINPSEPRVTEWNRITLMLASEALSCAEISQKLYGDSDKSHYASTNYMLKNMEGARLIKRDGNKRWSLDEEGQKELVELTSHD